MCLIPESESQDDATLQPARTVRWIALALAVLPLLLFAYLGQFSRLMSDDYCAIAVGQELGAWQGMVYWFSNWAGSYANFFFKSAIAPLDTLVPALTPAIIVGFWWLAGAWLVAQILAQLQFASSRNGLAVLIAAGLVAASINAFYSPQSFYWFAASTHYTLPLTLLTAFIGMIVWTARSHTPTRTVSVALAGATLCFVSAGSSEIFVAFQLSFLTLCLLPLLAFKRIGHWHKLAWLIGASWLVTLVAWVLQLSSPGLAIRATEDAALFGRALRSPAQLFSTTRDVTFEFLGHPEAFAGFMLLFGLGFLSTRFQNRAQFQDRVAPANCITMRPLLFGLAFQVFWIPLLWTHTSFQAQFLGRFSVAFLSVVAVNLLLVIAFLLLIWQRDRVTRVLGLRSDSMAIIVGATLVCLFACFAMTQIRNINYRATAYLFTTAISFLVLLSMLPAAADEQPSARRVKWFSQYSLVVALVSLAAIVFAALFGRGFVDGRILAPASFLLVLPGLLWGIYLGISFASFMVDGSSKTRLVEAVLFVSSIAVTIGMFLGHASLIPDFQAYSRDWDDRHQEILFQRESGQSVIVVSPLRFDMAEYVDITTLAHEPANRCARRYYGIDSITVIEP